MRIICNGLVASKATSQILPLFPEDSDQTLARLQPGDALKGAAVPLRIVHGGIAVQRLSELRDLGYVRGDGGGSLSIHRPIANATLSLDDRGYNHESVSPSSDRSTHACTCMYAYSKPH